MKTIIVYLNPSELAIIRDVPLSDIFTEIQKNKISFYLTEDGMKIPVIYKID